ncbi:D-methionine transport system ATP-binding protein [Methylobacterium sp. ap11]|uniref:methionine ABC transporter ATP-binding protein n=1 Tax=Methylobacterium sp. ap11 TaxID=1761799 RepID=UPI0008BC866B|nr:ATP-binding cassette domain-containing protein [Methylobacterium sp. ap11]SEP49897.1 D-methionine transport system ATP-binding protein [Methylobacterium sp. ap11]
MAELTVPLARTNLVSALTPPARRASGANQVAAGPPRRAGSVRFEAIGKTYHSSGGEVRALSGIDTEVPEGSVFGIIGRSGAGKSSLLRLVNRLEEPTEGRVLIDGDDIAALDTNGLVAFRRRVGMVFQHFNLLAAKTVRENVALPLLVAGVPRAEIERRVADVLALVGLEGKERAYPSRLSGGQKQRVGIARALVSGPEILLCDEATSALDPETTLQILGLLKDINRRLSLTVILITHEMSVIREICDRVLVLERGEVAETGLVWQVFGDPQHAATKALLEPLARGLPDDLAARLSPERSDEGSEEAVIELRYSGTGEPDVIALSARFPGGLRLLDASLDRIGGHTQGRLLVAVRLGECEALGPIVLPSTRARVLGYV